MRKYNFSGIGSAPTGAVAPIYKTKEQAEEEKNKGGFFGGAAYLGEKAAASFVQSLEGIWDYTAGGLAKLFGADDWAEAQFRNDWFGDWYTHADEWYNPGEKMKVAGDVAGGIGTSLPGIAAGVGAAALTVYSGGTAAPLAIKILGAALPATVAGLGAAGTSTKQAYQETGELGAKEFGYGALSGTVEGATEAATNALTLGGGAVIKNIGKAFGKEMTETVAKQSVLKGLFGAFGGEAFEEGLSEWVNPYLAQLTYDPNAEEATAQEIAYAAFVGGLSGMVMQGGNVAIDSGNSFLRGTSIANRGLEGEVLNLSAQIAAFQDANNTENEAFRTVAETYKKLSESLEKTGGAAETAAQRKMLGDLSRANVAAVFSPMITRSAAQIYANADVIAARLTEYGYKDASGKPMTFTAEQIREGIVPGDKKSFEKALKTNTVLRTLAVASTTGQLTMDTRAFRDATLAGRNLASRADLWSFAENATADEVRAVSDALGIENWETLTEDEFAEKIATFLREGGAERYAAERAAEERIFADTGAAMPLPPTIALEDGQSRKFTDGERELAIARRGEEYRIYDMATRTGTKAMSRAEINKALADEREKRQSILAEAKESERRRAEIKRKREETDAWARENVKKYAELSAQSKTVVRKVIAAARASGLSESDVQMYATVSAHAGLDIVFSKRLCKAGDGYADAFWDPGKNRIVVNPEAKRSAEKILLHELDHAVRSGIRKDGGTKLFAEAIFGIDTEAAEKITARYKNVKSDVSKAELIFDEANAYFAETFFANKNVLASLTEKVPSLRERILAFFEGAKSDYAGAPRLEGAAKRYYTTYKKMFDEFAERNADRNAEEGAGGAARYALPEEDSDGNTLSAAQREYFAESKVLRGGKLLPLYHQTSADFTVFDTAREGAGARDNETPHGIFLKPTAENIGLKGNKQMKLYANITNPLVLMNRSSAAYYWKKNIDGYADIISQIAENDKVYGKRYDDTFDLKKFASRKNLDLSKMTRDEIDALDDESEYESDKILDEWEKANAELDKKAKALIDKYLRDNGFDGMFLKEDIGSFGRKVETYIALYQEQVKNADNANPTSDPDIRYALPEEDIGDIDAILGELYGEGIDIHRGTALVDTLPVIPESPRGKRYSRAEAMKIVDSLVSADYLKKKQKKDMVSSMFSAMNGLDGMAQISEYADTFAKFYVDKLMQIRIEHGDVPEHARQLSLLRTGIGKISFTSSDVAELRASLGREAAKNFLNRWARQGYDGVYPADVFLADLQQAYPEIADRIDGKTPMDALMAVNEMYDAAKERTGSGRYFKLYSDQSIEWQNMMARDIYNSIMQGFVSADKAVAAQALRRAEDNADFWQAKFDEGRVTDREFNEGFREKLKTEKSENAKLRRDVKRVERERDYFQAKREEDIAADREFRERQKEAYKTQTKALRDSKAEAEKRAKIAEKDLAEAIKKQKYAESVAENEQIRADYYQYEIQQRQEEYRREREEAELRHFDKLVAESNKRINAEEKAKQTKLAAREAEKSLNARGHISATVDKLQNMKKNRFTSAAEYQGNTFDKIVGELAKVEHGGNFSPTKAREAMKLLSDWYTPENPLFAELAEDDPDAWVKDIHEMVKSLASSEGAFTSEQLGTMDNVLRYFVNYIKNYNKVFYNGKLVEATGLAEEFVGIATEAKKYTGGAFFRSVGRSYLETFADPATVVRRMDGYRNGFYTKMLDQLRQGAIRADVNYYNLTKRYEEFMDKNKNYLREAEKATVKFEGRDIPKMQAIGLYMTMKREHAHLGLLFNGFAYLDGDGEKVRVNGFAEAELSPEDAIGVIAAKRRKLEEAFTPEDIEYISILEKVYNEDARALKASRDMQRYGFTNAMDDYYYPIRRANTRQKVDTGDSGELDRVSSASFNKDIVTGAAGELLIENADTLFRRHARAVSQYEALSPAIEAYNKIFNLDVSGNKNKPVSVRTETEGLWASGAKYMRNLVEDVQGIKRDRGEGMELLGKIRGGYAKFQLGANPKTLASQISSIFASSSVLDYDAILGSTNISGKDVDDYCTLAMLRNADNTAAMAQGVLNAGKRVKYGIDKVSDAMMKPIGWMDRQVITRLFAACQVQVAKNNGPKLNTEENRVAAGELLTRVILETQQNSFATERSAAMRSGNEIMRTLTMFSADAMKVTGRVIDAFGEISALRERIKTAEGEAKAELKAQLKRANKRMGKSVGAMLGVAAYSAGIAQLFRWLYDKEKDEDESTAEIMIADFAGNMVGGLPIIKEFTRRFTDGFGVENYSLSMLNDLLDSTVRVVNFAGNVIKGNADGQNAAAELRNLAYTAGQFTGIPARNIYNMLYGLTKRFSPQTAYKVDEWFYAKNYENDLARYVREGDDRMTNMLLSLAVNKKTGSALSATAHTELHRLITAGYKILPREIGKTITVDGNEYEMSEEEREMVRAAYADVTDKLDTLFRNRAYTLLSDAEKQEAIRYLYNTAYSEAVADVYVIDRGNAPVIADVLGYDVATLAYMRTKGIEADKGKDGKSLPGTKKKKTVAAINALNISTEKKLFLICAKGYSLADGDVRGLTAQAAKKKLLAYILALPGKTKDEKARLAEMCGFAVKNGKISLKNTA